MNLTLEQRVEALEQNMKMLLGVEPLYKGKNNVHIDQERLNGIVREMRSEPLIKDEKVRKAVRAWAEANDDSTIQLYVFDKEINRLGTDFSYIEFDDFTAFEGLKDSKAYTIAELCGEEEE